MRLHEDREAFLYAVGLATEKGRIRESFLEKDYWRKSKRPIGKSA